MLWIEIAKQQFVDHQVAAVRPLIIQTVVPGVADLSCLKNRDMSALIGGIEGTIRVGGLPDVLIVPRIQDKFAVGVCDLDPLRPNIVLKTVFGLWVQLIDLDPKALAIGGRGHQVGRIQLPIIEITQGKGPCFSRCPKLQVDLCLGQNGDAVFPSCWGIRWSARLQTFDRQGIRGEISSSGVDLQSQLMHAGRLFISTKGVLDHLCTRGLGHFLPIELKPNGGVHRTLPAQAGRRRGEDAQRMGVCIGEARLETSVTSVVDEVRSVCILSNHCAFGVAEDHCEGVHLLLPADAVE